MSSSDDTDPPSEQPAPPVKPDEPTGLTRPVDRGVLGGIRAAFGKLRGIGPTRSRVLQEPVQNGIGTASAKNTPSDNPSRSFDVAGRKREAEITREFAAIIKAEADKPADSKLSAPEKRKSPDNQSSSAERAEEQREKAQVDFSALIRETYGIPPEVRAKRDFSKLGSERPDGNDPTPPRPRNRGYDRDR